MQDEDLGPDNEVLIDLLPRSPADDQPGETMLYRLVDAILALTAPKDEGWRPIESAPKDGEWVWLFEPVESERDQQFVGHFRHDYTGDEDRWEDAADCREFAQPTHWMPLPTAPTQSAGGTER